MIFFCQYLSKNTSMEKPLAWQEILAKPMNTVLFICFLFLNEITFELVQMQLT
jgi:hypothetical protein